MLALALGADAFWLEPSSLRLVATDIDIHAPPQLAGLKVAVISDLHGGAPYIDAAKIDQVVAMTNAAKPDIILLTGDYAGHVIGFHPTPVESTAGRLKALSAPLGVYAVLGNHDHKVEGDVRTTLALERSGITVLSNAHVPIRGPHGVFALAGLDDADTAHADPARALAGIAPDAATLCFTHSPDIFPYMPRTCALTIAGHTHGGQVALPLVGRLIVPSAYGQRYAVGTIREDGRTFFVSSGIGTSIIPVRFGVPPQIVVLTLR